ncbi:hypothetical protein OJ962_25310, partial [Solirubrobacter sp. CPCC 204708]
MKSTSCSLTLILLALVPSTADAAARPDLRVPAASATSTTVKVTVRNVGRARAARSTVRLVLSADAKRDRRDKVVARATTRALARGKSAVVKVRVPAAAMKAAGVARGAAAGATTAAGAPHGGAATAAG